jgi:hypothetical protein
LLPFYPQLWSGRLGVEIITSGQIQVCEGMSIASENDIWVSGSNALWENRLTAAKPGDG